jgi:RimJ/RimL family protein N-acetyltransferase
VTIHIEHPSRSDQIEAWAAILERVDDLKLGVDELRHSFEQDRESLWALAYLDEVPAGTGVGRPSSMAGSNFASVRVLPELRGRGVGSALLAAISKHALTGGQTKLWGRIRADDENSLLFATRRGFSEVSRDRDVMLDVTKLPPAEPDPPEGIELASFAERPDLLPAVFDVDSEVAPDVPGHEEHAPRTYDHWARQNVEGPGAMLEACFIALDGQEVIGYAALRRYGEGSPEAENLLTAVRRQWRGRGIATALKRAQIEAARLEGVERIFTTNDEANVAMRGVNARLGYEPQPERVVVSGPA